MTCREAGRPGQRPARRAALTSRHIVKGSDENTPYLGFNEFYSMRVLERLNVVPVARTQMSDDGRVLIVERFDVDADGVPTHGLEDACSLLGLPPHEKYATTTEKVLNATRAYLPPARVRAQLEHLGWLLLTNYVVRNADCHAKNISLYYTSRLRVKSLGLTRWASRKEGECRCSDSSASRELARHLLFDGHWKTFINQRVAGFILTWGA